MSVISVQVAVFFQDKGLLGPTKNNKHKISVTALCLTATFANVPQEEIELPQELRSRETYGFIGFNKETAAKFWG